MVTSALIFGFLPVIVLELHISLRETDTMQCRLTWQVT